MCFFFSVGRKGDQKDFLCSNSSAASAPEGPAPKAAGARHPSETLAPTGLAPLLPLEAPARSFQNTAGRLAEDCPGKGCLHAGCAPGAGLASRRSAPEWAPLDGARQEEGQSLERDAADRPVTAPGAHDPKKVFGCQNVKNYKALHCLHVVSPASGFLIGL